MRRNHARSNSGGLETKIACGLVGFMAALPLLGNLTTTGFEYPPSAERWGVFTTTASSPLLNARTGSFTCTAAKAGNHGPVRMHDRYHFQCEDGTPFFHVGTTSYN